MRLYFVFVILLVTVMTASAADLGNTRSQIKDTSHILMNQAWDRDGGEDMASAVVISELPFFDTGATCDNLDDYDVACPYTASTSADVVYTYIPSIDLSISVDLFGSSYDTKTYVLDEVMNVIACNDDSHYPGYVSFLEEAVLEAGNTYYIVIDGYGGDCGEFVLNVLEFIPPPPCFITCAGVPEGEPVLFEGYEDFHNGGCNSPDHVLRLQELVSTDGTYDLCGVGGWYIAGDGVSEYRDTDWYLVQFGETGVIEWTADSESGIACYYMIYQNCDTPSVPPYMLVGPCASGTLICEGEPFSMAWLFVGSTSYTQEGAGHDTNEFLYSCHFTGLYASSVTVENVPWGAVKSLYR